MYIYSLNLFEVIKYTKDGQRIGAVSGMGRNKNKWESQHSKRTAQKYAKLLRKEQPDFVFHVESVN